jgi:hypothetical protein
VPTPTYDLIASNVLGSSASSVTFSSIPATYRDLVVVVTGKRTSGADYMGIEFNEDFSDNYFNVRMYGDGSSATSQSFSGYSSGRAVDYMNTNFGLSIIHIMDYAQSKHKTILARGNSTSLVYSAANRWANTAAITSLTLRNGGSFDTGSSFYLYGIVS